VETEEGPKEGHVREGEVTKLWGGSMRLGKDNEVRIVRQPVGTPVGSGGRQDCLVLWERSERAAYQSRLSLRKVRTLRESAMN